MAGLSPVAPENRPGNVKFEKIWNRAKDCDVAAVVLHVIGTTLCMDNKHALTADEVIDCCNHGCVIIRNGFYLRPVKWGVEDGVAYVKCINDASETSTLLRFTSYTGS